MNELSTEVKAQEIHERAVGFYKISEQYGYKFLMEVKTIRDEKLYKELGFENFEAYTLSNFNFDKRTINRRLQDAESFGEEYETALTSFGKHKTHQLATFPENYRNEILKNGIETENGNKSIDEATTREIEKYKKQLKQRDEQNAQLQSQVEQAQRSESIARKQLEEVENREPEVIERYMEPEDYQETKNALAQSRHQQKLIEQRNQKLEKDIEEMKQRRDEVSEKSQKYDELNKALGDMNRKLDDGQRRLKAQKEVYDLVKKGEELIKEIAPMTYFVHDEYILNNEYAVKPIKKIADDLLDLSKKLNKQLNKGEIIDV
ncbi:hypothetical protein ACTFIB_11525 [Staphylococcus chromogenes]|uniref:hypothetical protein n=1 Tax=Staphylococcus chromogenes TaxID=46126 RepID=UPI003EBE24D8